MKRIALFPYLKNLTRLSKLMKSIKQAKLKKNEEQKIIVDIEELKNSLETIKKFDPIYYKYIECLFMAYIQSKSFP